jgi:sugar lactone lactonase YvrE
MPVRGDSFAQPSAVVADLHTGEIFVCDSRRNRVVIFDQKGRFRYEIPGGTSFVSPIDLAVDLDGYLFVLGQVSPDIALLDFDGRLIRRISLAGLPEDAGSPRFTSLALSRDGETVYLLDTENDRLWLTNRDGEIRHSIDMTVGRTQEEIELLRYGHIDVYGETLLVPIPTDGLVHLYGLDGSARGTVGVRGSSECQTMFPAAAALDDAGRMIVLDQQRALFMTWDVERGVCLSEHYGFGNAPGAFYQPSDLALDAAGRLYVSQGFEGRIQVYEGAQPALLEVAALEPTPTSDLPTSIADTGESDIEPMSPTSPAESEFETELGTLAAVEDVVRAWASAWSRREVEEYLSFYAAAFQPAGGMSRSAWEQQRHERLTRPRSVQVSLAEIDLRLVDEDRAEVAFVQTYRSNLFSDKVDKILTLERDPLGWKIHSERVVRTYRE